MSIERKVIGRNHILWLSAGVGAHGQRPENCSTVNDSFHDKFSFRQETASSPGLRAPQVGALHALLASETVADSGPATIVLPTGCGKTETMLAAFAHHPKRTLVIVPSDALRTQIAEKFVTLGVLPKLGVVSGGFLAPVVAVLGSGLKTAKDCDALIGEASVVVATVAAINQCNGNTLSKLVELCERLYVDEAHHVAASTWLRVAEAFDSRQVVQFTATPFREDGQRLGGRIIYSYPLALAQEEGYFSKINYTGVVDLAHPDISIAKKAVQRLRDDLANGQDHILMARVKTKKRAKEIFEIYTEIAADLNPLRIDTSIKKTERLRSVEALRSRESRIVVCVDMLGEGFDLPALKIAAIHDPHKSLAVTVQFVGRFARVGGSEFGDASVFVPRGEEIGDPRLRRLYAEDADWNFIIRNLSEAEVAQEQGRSDFEAGFSSSPAEIAIQTIQPKMSTVVYEVSAKEWKPDGVYEVFSQENLLTKPVAINLQERVLWFVTEEIESVRWGRQDSIREITHSLFIAYFDAAQGFLYINSSNNDSVHDGLAHALTDGKAALINGPQVYRLLHGVNRLIPTNIGLLDSMSRNRRFTMHAGADVVEGFGPGAATKAKTNIFARGYRGGQQVSIGASLKGRVWSYQVASHISDWLEWAKGVGPVLVDESIDIKSVMSGFMIPEFATERPQFVPLGIEWPNDFISSHGEVRQVVYDEKHVPLIDVELLVGERERTGPIEFSLRSEAWEIHYEIVFGDNGREFVAVGDDAWYEVRNKRQPLSEFMNDKGLVVYFEQEAILSPDGHFLKPDRTPKSYPEEQLEVLDWSGIDLRKESQGPERDEDSVQYRVIDHLMDESDWDIVIDDDGTREVADVVALRWGGEKIEVLLAHCKYSSEDKPGARVEDIYEVCGQAEKSFKAKSAIHHVLKRLQKRERNRQQRGVIGFIKGDAEMLMNLIASVHRLEVEVTVVVAQPGLSKAKYSDAVGEVLGCAQNYLVGTYGTKFRVFCSA